MKKIFFSLIVVSLAFSLSACGTKVSQTNKVMDQEPERSGTNELEDISRWPIYEDKEDNVKFRYHRDLAYKVDESFKYEGYELYMGFSEGSKVSKDDKGAYPVEFVIIPEQKESEYVNGGKYISGFKKGDRFYYFSTYEMEKYGEIVDKMAESLEFIN